MKWFMYCHFTILLTAEFVYSTNYQRRTLADAVMVMAYDEFFVSSAPGPVASRQWFQGIIRDVMELVPRDRIVILVGAYGYDWPLHQPGAHAESLSFRTAMERARLAGILPVFEREMENLHFIYADNRGRRHEVWLQDALAIWNQVKAVQYKGISRIGVWRTGTEDASMWSFFDGKNRLGSPDHFVNEILPTGEMRFSGTGEVITILGTPEGGGRSIEVRPDGSIESGVYTSVPSGYNLELRGGNPRSVVLTFDDGPDPEWTPRVLDVLKEYNAPGLFFMLGEQVVANPELVLRVSREGHLIGNHTFTHPHMEKISQIEAGVQLSTAQRLIGGLAEKYTPLFRPPYTAEVDKENPEFWAQIRGGLQNGYMVVGTNVDSNDWRKPGAERIVASILDGLAAGKGNIILMHDGGGERSQSVEALRLVIPALRARGYRIVSLDQYLNISRNEIEIDLPLSEQLIHLANAAIFFVKTKGWELLKLLFSVTTLISILRVLFLGSVVIFQLKARDQKKDLLDVSTGFNPVVTVLIPAYNEEKVIARTLHSLLISDYEHIEVLVINDGSTDGTEAEALKIVAEDRRVRVMSIENAGKAAAANYGVGKAQGEIIVAVDADTIVSPAAISLLVRHFADPSITAVCGNVEVGNVNSLLTSFQSIEYVTSQNFDRRAFSALNSISVVPGALGAWRRSAMIESGGYSHDTLTEDADLTLTIIRNGGRVIYEADATARTEAPECLNALLKQRFRWTFGTYQCLWKHRFGFLRGPLGWVGLPNMFLFQILFPILSPIGDIVMLFSIFRGDWAAFLSGYIAFLIMDLCGSLLAFSLDRKPLFLLMLLPIQRFTYRQFMYYVSLKAMVAAIRGARHGWQKLDRTGSVTSTIPGIPAMITKES
jgi:cellulose synthase/poly-beta-1,6-N-acetylglucosamine synthase-like glycosyltransferase/peptidoglycan/xylan/chitin deacetylase (PgdA/CDA1 family)